jgi:hypothetical protein
LLFARRILSFSFIRHIKSPPDSSYRKMARVSPDKLSAYPRLSSLLNSGFMLICQSLTGKSDRKSSNLCYGFSANLLSCKGEQTHFREISLSSVVFNVFFRDPAHSQIHLRGPFSPARGFI